jgi:GxxExxY protein
MDENTLAKIVVDATFQIHTKLGPGLLESVYEKILAHELLKRNLKIERQKAVPIIYDGVQFNEAFRADLVVDSKIIIELKSIEEVSKVHKKQLLTYLKLTNMKLGLLINFGAVLIKDGIFRVVNGLKE